jgi:DNA-binding beta-propeller fold protein YncE
MDSDPRQYNPATARMLKPFVMAAVTLALSIAVFVPSALAGPPVHPPLPDPLHGFALNHACGTAVDSEGNIYVSNAGNSKVEVFDSTGNHLASIADPHEPCGLAVDSEGDVFVSEKALGNVVRYVPDDYPLSGAPSYAPAEAVDSSGEARGIAVDPFDDRLYVAKADRIDAYNSDGSLGINEAQLVQPFAATGGSYTLSFKGETTAPIAYEASHAEVQAALVALPAIGAGDITVGGGNPHEHLITFAGALAASDVEALTCDKSGLEGASPGCFTSTATVHFSGHLATDPLADYSGVAAYTYRVDNNRADRYLYTADAAADLVKVFSGPDIRTLKLRRTIEGPKPGEDFGFNATGATLAADPTNGHFFVFDPANSMVDEFEASGHLLAQVPAPGVVDAQPSGIAAFPQRDEIQRVSIAASGGTYTLGFEGQSTSPLPLHSSPSAVRAALESLSTIGPSNVGVSSNPTVVGPRFHVQFKEALGEQDVSALTVDGSGLTGGFGPEGKPLVNLETTAEGSGPGRLYLSSGPGAGAKLAAFGPLPSPGRVPLPTLSRTLPKAAAVATDSVGDVYVAVAKRIHVFDPAGTHLAEFEVPALGEFKQLAVDSTGKVYLLDGPVKQERVTYYTPSAYPPVAGTTYLRHEPPVATGDSFSRSNPASRAILSIAINPANDHLLVAAQNEDQIIELDSAAPGHESALLNADFGAGLGFSEVRGMAVDGNGGKVYLSSRGTVMVLDAAGTEVVARIRGAGSTEGQIEDGFPAPIAVDQSNGHVFILRVTSSAIEEFDSSGAFVGRFHDPQFGELQPPGTFPYGLAIDNGPTSPNRGNLYLAYDQPLAGTPDLWAFGPLSYGEPPIVVTGAADGLGAGMAVLHGSVDPRGFAVEECRFEYVSDAQYLLDGEEFSSAAVVPCAESPGQIGHGVGPVAVHADLAGLDPAGRYRYRLFAEGKHGESAGDAALFGPPLLTARAALPVLYDEATLRAEVEPSGLATTYRFEYGTGAGEYDQSTPAVAVPPGEGPVAAQAALTGLAEGVTYHFRAVAENEAGTVSGPDQAFTTLRRAAAQSCPNTEYRTGLSAALPDCRAYELTTPAETAGLAPAAEIFGSLDRNANNWLAAPGGGSLAFFTNGSLPGFEGNGRHDGYRAERAPGAHPAAGWSSELVAPSYAQAGAGVANQIGVSPDQRYSFWGVTPFEALAGVLADGEYLSTPAGFEPVGQGEPAPGEVLTDLQAEGRFLSAGGAHVIFASGAQLLPAAAPAGTEALYDRAAGSALAEVISVAPGGVPFGAGEGASFIGASEDGSAVVFRAAGVLYLHRDEETLEIAAAPNDFAGISSDGGRVFYAAASDGSEPADLFACDAGAGPCAGPGALAPIAIAEDAIFANVSEDGGHAFFISEQALGDGEENENGEVAETGEPNLYAWGPGASFIARLDPADLDGFEVAHQESTGVNLRAWTSAIGYGAAAARGDSPTRSTPDGRVLLFQSHARLSGYENEGRGEIYRYDSAGGEELSCVSCDPSGAPPSTAASLQTNAANGTLPPVNETSLIPNVTLDGEKAFFQSFDRLLPEDANDAQDVYEWKANGAAGCNRPGGCLALISSGQGEEDSHLYGMSRDGRDVFFATKDKLVGADLPGSPSIYDARVEGGIPEPVPAAPCQGDACQGNGSPPPALPAIASGGSADGNEAPRRARCAKGRHRVKGRCVAKHAKKRHPKKSHDKKSRASHDRRAGR